MMSRVQAISLMDDPALKLIGLAGKIELKDLSERHDDYLLQFARAAFQQKSKRRYARNLRWHRGLGGLDR